MAKECRNSNNLLDPYTIRSVATEKGISVDANQNVSKTDGGDARWWSISQADWLVELDEGTYYLNLYFSTPSTHTGSSGLGIYYDDVTVFYQNNGYLANKSIVSQSFTLNEKRTVGIEVKAYDGVYNIMLSKTNGNYEPYGSEICSYTPDISGMTGQLTGGVTSTGLFSSVLPIFAFIIVIIGFVLGYNVLKRVIFGAEKGEGDF